MYKLVYEELGKRQSKPVKPFNQAKLEAYTIWGVNLVLFVTVVLGRFVRFK